MIDCLTCAGSAGDVDNARLVFQNALADEGAQRNPAMWRAFQAFEVQHGSIHELVQLEANWRAALPQEGFQKRAMAGLDRLRRRYTHFDLWPCTLAQRAHLEPLLEPRDGAGGANECASCHVSLFGNNTRVGPAYKSHRSGNWELTIAAVLENARNIICHLLMVTSCV